MQPDLKVSLDADRPHIKCSKGYADAIDLYVDRKDGAGFVLIGRLLKLDYIDVVSLPANTVLGPNGTTKLDTLLAMMQLV